MTVKELIIATLAVVCVVQVLGDYGHGGHSVMVPSSGGGRRKWSIRARGKGMQNMMQMHYPKYEKKEEKKKAEVVYYPVPVESHKEDDYGGYKKGYESSHHQMAVIPMHHGSMHHGYGYH